MSRDVKFRCWNDHGKVMHDWSELVEGNKIHLLNAKSPTYKIEQYTGLKDKNGVEIYEGDIVNICYTSRSDEFIFDGIYSATITPAGVVFDFIKILWECGGYNQCPYERAAFTDYGFIRSDYKNKSQDLRPCIAECSKWSYSNYFEVIGNIHENPELLERSK